MKKIILILFSAILLGGCNRQDAHQPLGGNKIFFSKAEVISQSFISSAPNLNITSICLRNVDRVLSPFEFSLHESTSSSEAIRSIDFSGGNIDNQDCTRFQFEPVIDSEGKLYVAQIKPKLSLLEDPRINIYLEANPGQDYLDGQAYVDNVETPYDLHFKTYYQQDLKTVVSESLSNFLIRFTKDPIFTLVWSALIIVVIWVYRKAK